MVKPRESNWELMRIVAMLMIVSGHFVAQSNVREYCSDFELWLVDLLGLWFRIAVNLFLMLGCWFMVEAKFKAARVLQLAAQTMFYSLGTVLVLMAIGYKLKMGQIFSGFFPFSTTLWFATSYLALLLLSPYLQRILQWERLYLRNFLAVLFLLISGECTFHKLQDTYLCTLIWFIFMYLAIGYYKKYLADNPIGKIKCLVCGGGTYVFMVSVLLVLHIHSDIRFASNISDVLVRFMVDYKSLPNVLIAFAIFMYFQKLSLGYIHWINQLAKSAFAVYLLHQAPGIIEPLWFDFFRCREFLSEGYSPVMYTITVTIACYIIASAIDCFRRNIFKMLFDSKMIKLLCRKMDDFYNPFIGKYDIFFVAVLICSRVQGTMSMMVDIDYF